MLNQLFGRTVGLLNPLHGEGFEKRAYRYEFTTRKIGEVAHLA
jgi:hypothetical protein